jgi:hypothetical protein
MCVTQAALFDTSGLTLAVLDLDAMGGQLEAGMRNLSIYLTTHMNTSACKSAEHQESDLISGLTGPSSRRVLCFAMNLILHQPC